MKTGSICQCTVHHLLFTMLIRTCHRHSYLTQTSPGCHGNCHHDEVRDHQGTGRAPPGERQCQRCRDGLGLIGQQQLFLLQQCCQGSSTSKGGHVAGQGASLSVAPGLEGSSLGPGVVLQLREDCAGIVTRGSSRQMTFSSRGRSRRHLVVGYSLLMSAQRLSVLANSIWQSGHGLADWCQTSINSCCCSWACTAGKCLLSVHWCCPGFRDNLLCLVSLIAK